MKQYHPEEILVVEVESDCSNASVAGRVLKRGKNRLEILAAQLPLFEKELETDLDTFNAAQSSWQQWVENTKATAKTPAEANEIISKRSVKDHPYSRFRALTNRDVKPLRAITVIESKGKRVTSRNKEADLMEAVRLLIENFGGASTPSTKKGN